MKTRYIIILLILILIVLCILIVLPPSTGKITPFLDANGNIIENSIAEKAYIDVDGVSLGMVIRGVSMDNPVLLFLGGGPGIPQYWISYQYPTDLEQHFTVCYLSYRGSGLSYSSDLDINTINLEQYLKDTEAVTNYLRERFSQDKIYLMGHSFGTSVAVHLASLHPEYFNAYIAIAQINNSARSEQIAYFDMLEYFKNQNNSSMTRRLEKYYDYFSQDASLISSSDPQFQDYLKSIRDKAMHASGVGTMHNMNSVITGIFFPSLRMTDFTPMERINIWRGKVFVDSSSIVASSFGNQDLIESVPALDIPVYFFGGVYDETCCYELQKEYFEALDAPVKGFYTFEQSAHSPLYEEPERAMEILVNDVLNGTTTMAD